MASLPSFYGQDLKVALAMNSEIDYTEYVDIQPSPKGR